MVDESKVCVMVEQVLRLSLGLSLTKKVKG